MNDWILIYDGGIANESGRDTHEYEWLPMNLGMDSRSIIWIIDEFGGEQH